MDMIILLKLGTAWYGGLTQSVVLTARKLLCKGDVE